MCDFCNDIKDAEWYKEHDSYDRINAIVQTGEKTFGLWIECEDCYYSGVVMKIKYCPMCGNNLSEYAEWKERMKHNDYYQKYGFEF